jgi:hypothetical protein
MNTFKLNIPNDYNSETDTQAAIDDCYGGDSAACESDNGQSLYESIAMAAKAAGLEFIEGGDFGATWGGTDAQFGKCVELLPGWAKRYASKEEDK